MATGKFWIAGALSAALLTGGCVTDPETGERGISRAAIGGIGGAVGGYLLGDLVGGRRDRTEKILGAGIGGLAGAGIGAYMDRQERDLRARTAGTDVEVTRRGDDLVLNMPSGITFAYDSANVQPQFRSTLDQVADVLRDYNQTYIDVYGHTDLDGVGRVQPDAVGTPRGVRRQLSDLARSAVGADRHPRLRRKPAGRVERNRGGPRREPPGGDQDRADRPGPVALSQRR